MSHELPSEFPPSEGVPAWANTWGIGLIVYAILGCGLTTVAVLGAAFGDTLARMGGMELPPLPPAMQWWNYANLLIGIGLAIALAVGAVALMRGKPVAAKRLVTWATARIILAGIGLVISLALAPTADRYQESVHNAQREMVLKRTNGSQDMGPYAGSTSQSMAKWTGPLMTIVVCIVPVIVAILIGRKRAEIESWPASGLNRQ